MYAMSNRRPAILATRRYRQSTGRATLEGEMPQPRVSRLVLARQRSEPLEAGRPNVRRYRLARLEQVAAEGLRPRPIAQDRVPESGRKSR